MVANSPANRPLRVASLNLRSFPSHARIADLAAMIAHHEPDIALLQECKPNWLAIVCERAGLEGVHSHQLDPPTAAGDFPPDGTAIAVRAPLEIASARRLPPESFALRALESDIAGDCVSGLADLPERLAYRYSARTLLAEVTLDGRQFVAGSFHATPGTGKLGGLPVGEWKPYFHGAVALALEKLELPFAFAIDANEPLSEDLEGVEFHWAEGRPGWRKLDALLGLEPRHRARDLLRESLAATGTAPAHPDYLGLTYTIRGGGARRFDSIWATPEFTLREFTTHYQEARDAGTDHALIVADVIAGMA